MLVQSAVEGRVGLSPQFFSAPFFHVKGSGCVSKGKVAPTIFFRPYLTATRDKLDLASVLLL
jgi:hypothetical protein